MQFLERKGDGTRDAGGGRGFEDDYGAPSAPAAPRGNAPRGGQGAQGARPQGGYGQQGGRKPQQMDDDLGPAFPSEASNMDDVPF